MMHTRRFMLCLWFMCKILAHVKCVWNAHGMHWSHTILKHAFKFGILTGFTFTWSSIMKYFFDRDPAQLNCVHHLHSMGCVAYSLYLYICRWSCERYVFNIHHSGSLHNHIKTKNPIWLSIIVLHINLFTKYL